MSRYQNSYQPSPAFFDIGNAFLGGVQQSQDNQRQNALLDIERGQFGLQQRRQGVMEDQYLREIQGQQQASQAQQAAIQRRAQILAEVLPDEFKDMAGELAYELDEADVAKLVQERAAPGGSSMPADVQTAMWYQNASPEERRAFDVTKRNPTSPQLTLINGVPTIVERTPDRLGATTPLSSQESEQAAAEARKAAEARGTAVGGAAGDRQAKQPMYGSLEYVVGELEKQIPETPTGGPFGLKGMAGPVLDYQDSARFDNLREQLSTELRAIFRIPGEGTLSDWEQKQYGLQLPDRKYSEEVNNKILKDITSRAGVRVGKQSGQGNADNDPLGIRTP